MGILRTPSLATIDDVVTRLSDYVAGTFTYPTYGGGIALPPGTPQLKTDIVTLLVALKEL